ncbi:MAG: hypothetical protein OHK0039_00310 [Bacteroidia bacterium]
MVQKTLLAGWLLCLPWLLSAQLPDGFSDQFVSAGWTQAVGLTFDETGRMYVWSKDGKVYGVEDDQRHLLLDISEEVANYGDHGLLGFALHPAFRQNGYFYLLYVVDRYHLLYHGTAGYDPRASITEEATIGRVTRYTADPATGCTTLLPDSRKVLIGESIGTGLPMLHKSHGVGALVFGTDGTLLVSCGDGGSYAGTDVGGAEAGAYAAQALADGIIQPAEDVGAFRAQMIDSHNGKVLRIDPATGDGLSSNPFFDPARPRAARSRVWAMGLRNPFRMSLRPETGSHNPADGDPGVLYIGDVGWAYWEEVNIAEGPGTNFGWPIYEGVHTRWQYHGRPTFNRNAPNPLYGQGCDRPFFTFQELLGMTTLDPKPFFPNPCNTTIAIPEQVPHFVHRRPAITYSNHDWNDEEQGTYTTYFDTNGQPVDVRLDHPNTPVVGDTFTGVCTVGGVFYTGTAFPPEYRDRYLIGDYSGWLRQLTFDGQDVLRQVDELFDGPRNITTLALNPLDGCLYYLAYAYSGSVRRICYGGNVPPTAVIEADTTYGPSPLTVRFSAAASSDPDDDSLSYHWDFGDGTSSPDIAPVHTFEAAGTAPQAFRVRLTVRDSAGAFHLADRFISLNNTPPRVRISSFEDGAYYTTTGYTYLPLTAEVSDAEQSVTALRYTWQTFLHHNTHYHAEPVDTLPATHVWLPGEGCDLEPYWYRVRLVVADGFGLSAMDEGEVFPYCGPAQTVFDSLSARAWGTMATLRWKTLRETSGALFRVEESHDGRHFAPVDTLAGGSDAARYEVVVPYAADITHYRIATVGTDGYADFSPVMTVVLQPPAPIWLYPNPVRQQLYVRFEAGDEATLELYDLKGKRVFAASHFLSQRDEVWTVYLPVLAPGLYLYRVGDGMRVQQGKLMVE